MWCLFCYLCLAPAAFLALSGRVVFLYFINYACSVIGGDMQHYNRMMIISGQWPSVSRCVCVCVARPLHLCYSTVESSVQTQWPVVVSAFWKLLTKLPTAPLFTVLQARVVGEGEGRQFASIKTTRREESMEESKFGRQTATVKRCTAAIVVGQWNRTTDRQQQHYCLPATAAQKKKKNDISIGHVET